MRRVGWKWGGTKRTESGSRRTDDIIKAVVALWNMEVRLLYLIPIYQYCTHPDVVGMTTRR